MHQLIAIYDWIFIDTELNSIDLTGTVENELFEYPSKYTLNPTRKQSQLSLHVKHFSSFY